MAFSLVPVMAEEIESYYDGIRGQFEDGFEIHVLSDWLQLELSES